MCSCLYIICAFEHYEQLDRFSISFTAFCFFVLLQTTESLTKSRSRYKVLASKYIQVQQQLAKHVDTHHPKYIKNVVLRFLSLYGSKDTVKCEGLVPVLGEVLEMSKAERKMLTLAISHHS